VQKALRSIQGILQTMKKIPENGAIFCAGYCTDETKSEIYINEILEPIHPITRTNYFCDKEFHIEPYKDLFVKDDDIYLIVICSGEQTLFNTLQSTSFTKQSKISIHRQKNHKKGGQSAQRFDRIGLNQIDEYVNLINEKIISLISQIDIKNIIIFGNGQIKDNVMKSANHIIKELIIGCETIDRYHPEQVIECSNNIITQYKYRDEEALLTNYYEEFITKTDIYVFGNEITIMAEEGMLQQIVVNTNMKEEYVKIINNIKHFNGDVKYISAATESGNRLLMDFNGIIGKEWYKC
jgi:peptide chain release factor subunit 1